MFKITNNYSKYLEHKTFQYENPNVYLCRTGGTITGDIHMSCNTIQDVSQISFCNGKIFDGTTKSFSGTYLELNGGTMNDNIQMDSNNIIDIYSILFSNGSVLSMDISSVNQNTLLPSIDNNPISLQKMSIFRNDISYSILQNETKQISFGTPLVNQLNLTISGVSNEIISPPIDLSGEFVEVYMNVKVKTSSANVVLTFDISGISGTSLPYFKEVIDTVEIRKANVEYYLTFGPHMFLPNEWNNTTQFVFNVSHNDTQPVEIIYQKIIFKSSRV